MFRRHRIDQSRISESLSRSTVQMINGMEDFGVAKNLVQITN